VSSAAKVSVLYCGGAMAYLARAPDQLRMTPGPLASPRGTRSRYQPRFLAELSDELAECVISRFAEANFARINNKAGFLMGIIRRVREDGPDGGGADLKILPRSVEHAIRGLMDEVGG